MIGSFNASAENVSLISSLKLQGELVMRKVSEYALRAEECRRLATQMKNPEQKKQIEDMAQAWELLAKTRTKHLKKSWDEPPQSK